jgi:hypothetical protein
MPEPEQERHDSDHKEGIERTSSLGGMALVGDVLSSAEGGERPKEAPVISGRERGYIRTSPEGVHSLLTQSFEGAHVIPDREPRAMGVIERATDIMTHCGVVILESQQRRRGIIEEYEALTRIEGGSGFDSLVIQAEGPLSASQLAERAEQIETPVGSILAEPKVEMTFTQRGEGGRIVTHRFIFAREGMIRFERSTDDQEGYKVDVLDSDTALDFLERNLPVVEDNAGQPVLSEGEAKIADTLFRGRFNNIRRNRLGHSGSDFQAAAQAKLDAYGYDTVMFVPERYFTSNSKGGEFFSVDVPEALIPPDSLELPDPEGRADRIISQMGLDVDEATVSSALYLAEGLPGGRSKVAVLIKGDHEGVPRPELRSVPTNVYDKALTYLLQHPEVVAETIAAHREMTAILGKPATEANIQLALEAGLLSRDPAKARELFEEFAVPLSADNRESADAQAALDKAFGALVSLGGKLRDVYVDEEIAHYTKDNAMLVAT